MKNKIIIGIDQSYEDTGIAISMNGEIKNAFSVKMGKLKEKSNQRDLLRLQLDHVFYLCKRMRDKYDADVMVLIERIRLRSDGSNNSDGFININYIKSIGALNAVICDCAYGYGYPVYSVDTRAWKNCVVGTTKPKENDIGINPKKYPTILWCNRNGYRKYIKEYIDTKSRKQIGVLTDEDGKYVYNDNIADSICISLCGFVIQNKLLKLEK